MKLWHHFDKRKTLAITVLLTTSALFLTEWYIALLVPFFVYITLSFLYENKKSRLEEELPRWIHTASTYPSITPTKLVELGTKGFGVLSSELQWAKRLIDGGIPPLRALRRMGERWDSPLLERTLSSIIESFRSGTPSELLKNLSEELYTVRETEKEKLSIISLQRYSIALSSFFLVPIILGFVTRLVERMGGEMGDVVILYILMLVFISGVFLALVERKPKNVPFYIMLGSLISLTVYVVVAWYS